LGCALRYSSIDVSPRRHFGADNSPWLVIIVRPVGPGGRLIVCSFAGSEEHCRDVALPASRSSASTCIYF
ncbi:unnamed protein product, partial [Brassica oleracea]